MNKDAKFDRYLTSLYEEAGIFHARVCHAMKVEELPVNVAHTVTELWVAMGRDLQQATIRWPKYLFRKHILLAIKEVDFSLSEDA